MSSIPLAVRPSSQFDMALSALLTVGLDGRAEVLAALVRPAEPPIGAPRPSRSALNTERSRAARAVRVALAPLVARKAPSQVLRAAALAARSPILAKAEVTTIVNQTIEDYLRRRRGWFASDTSHNQLVRPRSSCARLKAPGRLILTRKWQATEECR